MTDEYFKLVRPRCTYSEAAYRNINIHERFLGRKGVIAGITNRGECYKIFWDGRYSPDSLHKDYIKIIPFDTKDTLMEELRKSEIF